MKSLYVRNHTISQSPCRIWPIPDPGKALELVHEGTLDNARQIEKKVVVA